MKFIVCGGAGDIGNRIVKQLVEEEHDVTIIDTSIDKVRYSTNHLDINAFVGSASNPDILAKAGAKNADVIISVTGSDEMNMLISQISYSVFAIPTKIARIRKLEYKKAYFQKLFDDDHIPIDLNFSPDMEIVNNICRRLLLPDTVENIPIVNGEYAIIAIKSHFNNPYLNYEYNNLAEMLENHNICLMFFLRNDEEVIDFKQNNVQKDDIIFFAVKQEDINNAMLFWNIKKTVINRLLIIGAGNIGSGIIDYIQEHHSDIKIKIIEFDDNKAKFIANHSASNTHVICGSAISKDILEEAHVSTCDIALALSNDPRINIVSSLMIKAMGCKKTLALLDYNNYSGLFPKLDIDMIIDPGDCTLSSILPYIRKETIQSTYSVGNGKVEIIEIEILSSTSVMGSYVRNLKIPKGARITMIIRKNKYLIPNHETFLQIKDIVIIVCKVSVVKKIENIFSTNSYLY